MLIPATLLFDLERIPRDKPVALLMRHAARHPITDPDDPYSVGLTEEGVVTAEALGGEMAKHVYPGRILSSPVERCVATGMALARGADWPVNVQTDERLSHLFIAPAWYLVQSSRMTGPVPFQVRVILHWMLRVTDALPRVDIFVTHDTVLGAVVGGLLHVPVTGDNWPGYLDGLFLWRGEQDICARWRGIEYTFPEKQLRIE
jgi:hypothetical protein